MSVLQTFQEPTERACLPIGDFSLPSSQTSAILINAGRRSGGVGVLINNHIKHQSQILDDKPEITSFESIELVITLGSVTIRLSVKSKNGLKQGEFCNEFNDYLEKLSCMEW